MRRNAYATRCDLSPLLYALAVGLGALLGVCAPLSPLLLAVGGLMVLVRLWGGRR